MAAERVLNLLNDEDDDYEIDSDEELMEEIFRKPRWIRERTNYFEHYDENNFKTHFRLTKQSALKVLELVEQDLEYATEKNHAISPINQLLCTLRYYATGCAQLEMGDFCGFSISTANRTVHRVSSAIARLAPKYITFPDTRHAIERTQVEFYRIAKFPKVVGAIDCTHIRMASPGGPDAELFRNRNGYFSLNVQAICNSNLEFLDIVARWPGSSHDSYIFKNCKRKTLFDRGVYGDAVLVGDSSYAVGPYMITPLDNPTTPEDHLFNESQIRTRKTVERCFEVWKRRFPVLALGMRVHIERVFPIVVATAVLHNILQNAGEELPADDPVVALPAPWDDLLRDGNINPLPDARVQGQGAVRNSMINNYFKSLLPYN